MTLEEVKSIMQKEYDKYNNKPHPCWADIEAAPHGVIENEEQYKYAIEYAKNTSIDTDALKSYESAKGMYLDISGHFGGASFYFTLNNVDYVETMQKKSSNIYPKDLKWSYGKYGKIDFL